MVRSAAALVAVLILPSFAQAQEPQGTHTVVRDDTLWDLAIRYYNSPWEWRTIYEANRDVVEDPHWIYPAEVLVIPGLPGQAAGPAQEEPMEPQEPMEEPVAQDVPPDLVPFGLRPARPVQEGARSIFYRDPGEQAARFQEAMAREYAPVSSDRVWSAPWLIRLEAEPVSNGMIAGFATPGVRGNTMRQFDMIRIQMPSPARVGANLQLFTEGRTIPMVGRVMRPVGVATVRVIGDGEVIARVEKVYGRIGVGNMVRPLPAFTAQAGVYAEPISGGSEAMIMGFAGRQEITDIGHVAFLDLGSDDGIVIGDEFVLYGAATNDTRGVMQVIYTTPATASARVMQMDDDVWKQGVIVRLARKMR